MSRRPRLPRTPIDLLELVGFSFVRDGESVAVLAPISEQVEDAAVRLESQFQAELLEGLRHKDHLETYVHVGGPFDKEPHRQDWGRLTPIAYSIERSRWAVYTFGPRPFQDGRLWFRGWATSQAKARRLTISDTTGAVEAPPMFGTLLAQQAAARTKEVAAT